MRIRSSSPAGGPLTKGQDLSDNVNYWLLEKEGHFAKLTISTYGHALSQFVLFWNLHKRPDLTPYGENIQTSWFFNTFLDAGMCMIWDWL